MSLADGRRRARLASLNYDALLDLAARMCTLSAETRRLTDSKLAEDSPLPEWVQVQRALSPPASPAPESALA